MKFLLRFKRFLAATVTVSFLATSVPAPPAQAQGVEVPNRFAGFEIPAEFGKVTEIIPQRSPDSPLLIHIQEAHANYDAQRNIKNILEYLSRNYGVQLVLLEGAGNKLDPTLFKFFPGEPELQNKINSRLMEVGELTGAEVFLIDRTMDAALRMPRETVEAWGVEEAGLYAKNREDFRQVFEGSKLTRSFLDAFYLQWQKLAALILNKPLREFLSRETAFEKGELPLSDWMTFLKTAAVRDLRLDLDDVREQKEWPILVRYFRLKAIDPKIDGVKAETEKKLFLEDIRRRGARVPGFESLIGEIEQVFEQAKKRDLPVYKTRFVFEKLLDRLPKDFSFEAYPNLKLYLQQIILLSELQGDVLQDEIKKMTGKLTARLIKTEKERQFAGILHDYRLVKKLFELELNRDEYQTLLSRKITPEELLQNLRDDGGRRAEGVKPGLSPSSILHPSFRIQRMKILYGTAIRFYEGAIGRENKMAERAFARMRERKQTKAVLITGGFHTDGLKAKALSAGSSYIEITPHIGEITPDSRKNYLTVLLGKKSVETSQISGIKPCDILFEKEVSPRGWRRELAALAARLSEHLQQVAGLERAREAVSGFVATAVGISAVPSQLVPVAGRSEMREAEKNVPGLMIAFPIKDMGATSENEKFVTRNALKKMAALLGDFEEQGQEGRKKHRGSVGGNVRPGSVYIYNGLYRKGPISESVHTVPDAGEHFITSEDGKTTVRVAGYTTKRKKFKNGWVLRDDGGNPFSIMGMTKFDPRLSDSEKKLGTTEQTRRDFVAFAQKAHDLGIKVVVDFIPSLAPDTINESNLHWTFHKKLTDEENRYFRGLPEGGKKDLIKTLLRENPTFFAKRIGEGDREEVVLVRHFPGMDGRDENGELHYNADQTILNIFEPDVLEYFKRSIRALIDLGADKVRVDMAKYLVKERFLEFLNENHLSAGAPTEVNPLREIIREASSYANKKGRTFGFIFETYDQVEKALIETSAQEFPDVSIETYDAGLFESLFNFSRGPGETRGISDAIIGALKPLLGANGKSGVISYLSNYDQIPVFVMGYFLKEEGKGFSVAGALSLACVLAILVKGYSIMITLRDWLSHTGDVRPMVGGDAVKEGPEEHAANLTKAHAHPFANDEELEVRTRFKKLREAFFAVPQMAFLKRLSSVMPEGKLADIQFLDNWDLRGVISIALKIKKKDGKTAWLVYAVDLQPYREPLDPPHPHFVDFPIGVVVDAAVSGEGPLTPSRWQAMSLFNGKTFPVEVDRTTGPGGDKLEYPRIKEVELSPNGELFLLRPSPPLETTNRNIAAAAYELFNKKENGAVDVGAGKDREGMEGSYRLLLGANISRKKILGILDAAKERGFRVVAVQADELQNIYKRMKTKGWYPQFEKAAPALLKEFSGGSKRVIAFWFKTDLPAADKKMEELLGKEKKFADLKVLMEKNELPEDIVEKFTYVVFPSPSRAHNEPVKALKAIANGDLGEHLPPSWRAVAANVLDHHIRGKPTPTGITGADVVGYHKKLVDYHKRTGNGELLPGSGSVAKQLPTGKSVTNRSEMRAPLKEEGLKEYTIVSRQMEAGLDRGILEALNKRLSHHFQGMGSMIRRYVGLVAQTTLTGGLGALMHDLFPAWGQNLGDQNKEQKDIIAVNVIYDRIKGQQYAKYLPDEVRQGKVTLGDYLRSVLKADKSLEFSFELEIGDDFRNKAAAERAWAEQHGSEEYKDLARKVESIVSKNIRVDVYPTKTHFNRVSNYYIDAYFYDKEGKKIRVFDEVYPDAPRDHPDLWRDVHMAVYGWATQHLARKLQQKGVVKSKILFVDNEVFASTPTPMFPDAIHHHINHTVFRPGLYMPNEASYEMMGYPETQRKYIVKNGKIDVVGALGSSSRLITGVALYEHTRVLAEDIMAGHTHKLKSFNENEIRNTNGVLLEQWQSSLLRDLIGQYKQQIYKEQKDTVPGRISDRQFFELISSFSHKEALESFKQKAEFAKAVGIMGLLLWLKEDQNSAAWIDEVLTDYEKKFAMEKTGGQELAGNFRRAVEAAIKDPETWKDLRSRKDLVFLKELLLKNPIVANVRRQVSYKGPDKWTEILEKLKSDPQALAEFKRRAPRVIIGGREFGEEAHWMFLKIQALVGELGLRDRIATIEDYNFYIAPIIFNGISGAVMLSDEKLEASATSMMKAMTNMAALVGVWGGADPELFTIIGTRTGSEKDVFEDNITHDHLAKQLKEKKWKIANGFFVAYSEDERSSQEGGGRRPSAVSLLKALYGLNKAYQDPSRRRDLQFAVLQSTPKVDMANGQAVAHKVLWERAIQTVKEENELFNRIEISYDDAKKLFEKSLAHEGQPEFYWQATTQEARNILGLLGFVEGFRYLRGKGREGYNSIAYHATQGVEGDIFGYLNEFFEGFDTTLTPVIQKIRELAQSAQETEVEQEKVQVNLEALEIVDRLVVEASFLLLKHYIKTKDTKTEDLLANPAVRQNIAVYLEQRAFPFRSIAKKIRGYSVEIDGRKYLVALNLGEYGFLGSEGVKAWGAFYGRGALENLVGSLDDTRMYQIVDVVSGRSYGKYPLWKMAESIPAGVPAVGIQVLTLEDLNERAEEQEVALGKDVVDYLEALTGGRFVSEGQPITQLLFQKVRGGVGNDEKMARLLKGVTGLSREKAIGKFGERGIPPVMAFVAVLSPGRFEKLKDWNEEVYTALLGVLHQPRFENLFKQGEIWFHHVDRESAMVISRSLPDRTVFVPIHFAGTPFRSSDGKAWFRILDTGHLGAHVFEEEQQYRIRNVLANETYPLEHLVEKLSTEKWSIGIPVEKPQDPDVFQEPLYRFQILEMVPAPSDAAQPPETKQEEPAQRSEIRRMMKTAASGMNAVGAEAVFAARIRSGTQEEGPVKRSELRAENAWPQHEAQKIAVIGTGFVGATKSILLVTDWGHDVAAVDIQPKIVEKLSKGELTFHAPDLQELLTEGLGTGKLKFTTSYKEAIEGREIIFLAVQTPQSDSGHANIQYLKDSVREIAKLVHPGESKIIVGKSTAPPRDTVNALKNVVSEEFRRREAAGEDLRGAVIHFAWEPEFLREGKEVEDDRGEAGRIVIGVDDLEVGLKIAALYANPNPDEKHKRKQVPIIITDLTSAPLVKYAANGYRGMKISFINFISWLTEALGLDIGKVAYDMATQKDSGKEDSRIGRAFLCAGLGFGGSCFPKDLAAAVQISRGLGVLPGLVLDALAVNELQWRRFTEKLVIPYLQNVQGKTIAVLGASFKPGTDDIRESRAVKLIDVLLRRGAKIRVYDPVAVGRLRDPKTGPFKDDTAIEFFADPVRLNTMLEDADAVILATEWPDFARIDFGSLRNWFISNGKKLPPIFDGRNFFDETKLNSPEAISLLMSQLKQETPDLKEESLKFPYFNIGHGKTLGKASAVPHDEFVERVRESFLALRISYINMIAEIAERVGANIRDVTHGLGLDFVVGVEYLAPGIGWGGNKLSMALETLEGYVARYLPEELLQEFQKIRQDIQQKFEFPPETGQKEKTPVPFITTVKKINDQQVGLYIEKAKKAAGGLRGKKVAVLGLAYKPGEYTTYGSRSMTLIEALLKEGAIVHATDVDRQAVVNARRELGEENGRLKFFSEAKSAQENAREAVRGTEIQFLVTASPAFAEVKSIFFDENGQQVAKIPMVVDGRNFYGSEVKEFGIELVAVGVPLSAFLGAAVARRQALDALKEAVSFSEKNVRVHPLEDGRILASLKVWIDRQRFDEINIFSHFGFYEGDESPWQDQMVDPMEIRLLSESQGWGEYEITTVIDPTKSLPGKSGKMGIAFFVTPKTVSSQAADFFETRFYAGKQSVLDGQIEIKKRAVASSDAEARSEMRAASAVPITNFEQFINENALLGGGNLQGFSGVTKNITDGIWSLTAHTFNAVNLVAVFFGGTTAPAGNVPAVAAQAQTVLEKFRFAAALQSLGIKSIAPSDAFVLGKDLAFRDGALAVMRKIFGDVPVVILASERSLSGDERKLFQEVNRQLVGAGRPGIRMVSSLEEARKVLAPEEVNGRRAAAFLQLKAMANVSEASAVMLKQQLGDNAILVTSKRFRTFLELAGVRAFVESMQHAFFATAKSA